MAYSEKLKNVTIIASGNGVRVRAIPGSHAAAVVLFTANDGEKVGKATGNTVEDSSKKFQWIQIIPDEKKTVQAAYGYISSDYAKYDATGSQPKQVSKADAQKLLDTITQTDKKIRENLQEMAKAMGILMARGEDVSKYKDAQGKLIEKMVRRHRTIQKSSLIRIEKQLNAATGISANYNQVDWKGSNFPQGGAFMMGLGASAAVPVWLILSAVAIGAATLTYQYLKPHYDEGQLDLKTSELYKSEVLNKAKANLTPAEQKQLDNEIEKWGEDNYEKGRDDSNKGILSWLLGLTQTDKVLIALGLGSALWLKYRNKTPKNQ
jgi:hypothetical protein